MIRKRKKKWLGAVISGVAGIASSLINGQQQANAQKRALLEQERLQTKQNALQNAANLTAKYADTSYADAMQDKISFKAGGKTKDRVAVAKRFACGGRKRKSMGGTKNNDDPDTNKVSENYINRFPYVTRMLSEPPMSSHEKDLINAGHEDVAKRIMASRSEMGNKIIDRITNFNKNDSAVYTPLLDKTDNYLMNLYDKIYDGKELTNTEVDNIKYATNNLYNLSLIKTNPYNDKHKFVNDILTNKITDAEFDKLLGVKYYGKDASIIDAIKAKPKNISWWEAYKLYDIINNEYFNDNFIKKSMGGSYKEVNGNTIVNADNIVKSNIGLKMARMGAKYKRKCSK